MAKQTFTTGQVLTAAQMTSLQQTAMGGGSPVTKTASYVLTAADAGTTIQMNSASSTTITVNTALFAAGDVVFIQNIGAGVCTITAGTATVTTAGSLALTQWEGGQLYFTSTGASIFFDYIQAGVSIPLTTKGDLFGYDTANARVPIGTNGQVLTADSATALGLKWATPAGSGANWSLVNAGGTALTGAATVTVSGISNADKILVILANASSDTADSTIGIRFNSDTASNYFRYGLQIFGSATYSAGSTNVLTGSSSQIAIGRMTSTNAASAVNGALTITGCNASGVKVFSSTGAGAPPGAETGNRAMVLQGYYNSTSTISSVSAFSDLGNFDAGTIFVYTSA